MGVENIIAELSQPAAFPFAVEDVAVCHTHLSAVFLAGEFAYKIKKPVRLSFVDFSTLELRRYFCEREVQLNRRLAPDVYLDVVPVTREGNRLRFEGTGEVVEWAVKMRRLSESGTLAEMLRTDAVQAPLIRNLAVRIAEFHRTSESSAEISRFGRFEAIAANIQDNLDQAAKSVGTTISQQVCSRLTARTHAELKRLRTLIDHRAESGVPRDTHGDLRLEHVYPRPNVQPPGDWLIVDCIEFNDGFRYADPVADVAFLVMDLTFAGRRDLATCFADAYFAAANDAAGQRLLPLYTSYRSAVRAKVEKIEASEQEVPADERAAAGQRAGGHWLLALSELESPDRKPCVVLVGGLPGTGKSTVARQAAEVADFHIVRSDEIRKQLAGLDQHESARTGFGEGIYSTEWTNRTYAECLRQTELLLSEGNRVMVDATFATERHRRQFLDAAQGWGVTGMSLVCECDAQTVRNRLAHRRGDVSDADWNIYLEAVTRWETPSPSTLRATRIIDTTNSTSAAVSELLTVLVDEHLHSR
ncbi:MAG: AAA family ATPase [Planctomycetales bacterium]|nr:AAA family ATPase [Planctomycetales bacterium]